MKLTDREKWLIKYTFKNFVGYIGTTSSPSFIEYWLSENESRLAAEAPPSPPVAEFLNCSATPPTGEDDG